MSRRSSLPGAAELFRPTADDSPLDEPYRPIPDLRLATPLVGAGVEPEVIAPLDRRTAVRRTSRVVGERQPTGRERHDEKITVYVSQGELVDLEQARLTLRAEHGLAVDRGRIVREALAVVLADLETNGEASTLVRRLNGL